MENFWALCTLMAVFIGVPVLFAIFTKLISKKGK